MSGFEFHVDLGESDHDPYEFVEAVCAAEQFGFAGGWFGDHFAPWHHSGKKSAFVWSVMGVALEKTERIKVGPLVSTPIGGRYHPALVAQASATLDNMYPGRFLLGVGTGEAVNENPFFGNRWPSWKERIERLTEGLTLIRKLWDTAEPFAHKGAYFSSDFLYLYTKPKTKIPIYFSAVGKNAAYCAGKYGDHLVTLSPRNNADRLKSVILPSFKQGCSDANKKVGDVLVSLDISLESAEEVWRTSRRRLGFMAKDSWSLKTPIEVEERGEKMSVSDIQQSIHFCSNWKNVIDVIENYRQAGATGMILGTGLNESLMREYANNLLTVF